MVVAVSVIISAYGFSSDFKPHIILSVQNPTIYENFRTKSISSPNATP
jgi:hypothetical protein